MSNVGKTRVAGHTLCGEGKAYVYEGDEVHREQYDGSTKGYGVCSCGITSRWLLSNAARKRWHAEHKAAITAAGREAR
jgi:hypothetical protein